MTRSALIDHRLNEPFDPHEETISRFRLSSLKDLLICESAIIADEIDVLTVLLDLIYVEITREFDELERVVHDLQSSAEQTLQNNSKGDEPAPVTPGDETNN